MTSSLVTSVLSYTTAGKEKSSESSKTSNSLESSDIDLSEENDSEGRRKEIFAFLDSQNDPLTISAIKPLTLPRTLRQSKSVL